MSRSSMYSNHRAVTRAALALACAAAILPPAALANGPDYSYVEAGYVETDVDGAGGNLDGYGVRGSVAIADRWFAFAGYADQSYGGFDLQDYEIGGGYAWPLANSTDLLGKVSFVRLEGEFAGFSASDEGYAVALGIRSRFKDRFELEASVGYTELSDSGGDTALGVAARWYPVERFAIGIDAASGDDTTAYGVGLRWEFGN